MIRIGKLYKVESSIHGWEYFSGDGSIFGHWISIKENDIILAVGYPLDVDKKVIQPQEAHSDLFFDNAYLICLNLDSELIIFNKTRHEKVLLEINV